MRSGKVGGNIEASEYRRDWSLALLPCDLASKWQICSSLGYGWRANDTLRGLTWLLTHSEQQELTRTQFYHYALKRPLISKPRTLEKSSHAEFNEERKTGPVLCQALAVLQMGWTDFVDMTVLTNKDNLLYVSIRQKIFQRATLNVFIEKWNGCVSIRTQQFYQVAFVHMLTHK